MFKVVGVKRWKGKVDGNAIDSAKLFVEVHLDSSRNGDDAETSQFAAGLCTEEIKLTGRAMLLPIEGEKLPFYVELDTQRVSNGKTSRDVVTGVRLAKPALKAAA